MRVSALVVPLLETALGWVPSALAGPPLSTGKVQCSTDDPASCAAGMLKGQPAPFNGQLLTTSSAIELAIKAEHCDEHTKLEVSHTSSIASINLHFEKELHRIDVSTLQRENALLTKEVERKVDSPHWTSSPWFVVPVTVAATLGAIAIGIECVRAAGGVIKVPSP